MLSRFFIWCPRPNTKDSRLRIFLSSDASILKQTKVLIPTIFFSSWSYWQCLQVYGFFFPVLRFFYTTALNVIIGLCILSWQMPTRMNCECNLPRFTSACCINKVLCNNCSETQLNPFGFSNQKSALMVSSRNSGTMLQHCRERRSAPR